MLLEMLINVIAPYTCIGCGTEDTLLCSPCSSLIPVQDNCSRCQNPKAALCQGASGSGINHLYICTEYTGLAKELVRRLKFERTPGAAEHIAEMLAAVLLQSDQVVVPVRTSPLRYRQRGYDQTVLIAKSLSKRVRLQFCDTLLRTGSVRQLGAKRSQRLAQQQGLYCVSRPELLTGKTVLLVDDVRTTGATLESAAHTIRAAGVKTVNGLVFAQA